MENILKELSNPYDIEKFKKLLELYLDSGYMTSEGRREFYKNVVSYNQDGGINEDMTEKRDISISIPPDRFAESPILSKKMFNSHWLEISYFFEPRRCKTQNIH